MSPREDQPLPNPEEPIYDKTVLSKRTNASIRFMQVLYSHHVDRSSTRCIALTEERDEALIEHVISTERPRPCYMAHRHMAGPVLYHVFKRGMASKTELEMSG